MYVIIFLITLRNFTFNKSFSQIQAVLMQLNRVKGYFKIKFRIAIYILDLRKAI